MAAPWGGSAVAPAAHAVLGGADDELVGSRGAEVPALVDGLDVVEVERQLGLTGAQGHERRDGVERPLARVDDLGVELAREREHGTFRGEHLAGEDGEQGPDGDGGLGDGDGGHPALLVGSKLADFRQSADSFCHVGGLANQTANSTSVELWRDYQRTFFRLTGCHLRLT